MMRASSDGKKRRNVAITERNKEEVEGEGVEEVAKTPRGNKVEVSNKQEGSQY